jgi:aryl-alcohol dehydrogenase-like predicted oxidoreductase
MQKIGQTEIEVSEVAMGCWPIAGITSVDVTEENSLATLTEALNSGINFFDTAYCYGYEGESEKLIAKALGNHRDEIVIATKGGVHWKNKKQVTDSRPNTIRKECEESLQRLNMDHVELYYLHSLDRKTPLSETAGVFNELIQEGKILSAGISNASLEEIKEFHQVCPLSAYQPRYNMFQRDIEKSQLPWCQEQGISIMSYWPLMKGALAGKMSRDHVFDPKDSRLKYPVYQADEWEKTQNFLDVLRPIAKDLNCTIAQLVIRWTFEQPGITVALCGAKKSDQIRENAEAMALEITNEQFALINKAIQVRGPVKN